MQVTQINNSSNVFRVGHDGTDLYVEMKGGTYKYVGAPVEKYYGIIRAESAGKYLNAEIKPVYEAVRLEDNPLLPLQAEQELGGSREPVQLVVNATPQAIDKMFEVKHTGTLYRGSEQAAGFDLSANIGGTVTINPGQRRLIPTGVRIAPPPFMAALVVPRSGLALKKGISIVNAPGLIDPDYRGDIGVVLINLGDEAFDVNPGDRIAQLVFAPFYVPNLIAVDDLDNDTARGETGFGSTGVKAAA